ncbi:MAG TPA: hypothetical protein VLJ68_00370 [Chitinophagaceae bacterium]|nr:hypothetical protein [Chitinophagaceae bacterium]
MLNPYTLLDIQILEAMLRQPMYFVRQYYSRGVGPYGEEGNIPILLTHYIHHVVDAERAQRHMRLLKTDPYRFLYDSSNPDHREKLLQAATQPRGYHIYINLMTDKWKANDNFKRKIRTYVYNKLPWWNYSPADKLKVTLKERYGELYLVLLWKQQQTEVNLEEIENFLTCATI